MSIAAFQRMILDWYEINGRKRLPWRTTRNPYRILVSELMLQQTQVDRVLPKYQSFLKKFPSIRALAAAPACDVLAEWNGLGYNRRALYLHKAAKTIRGGFGGRFPREISDIEFLPGVGPYTARAVATFAFGIPTAFIETNIRRVFLHYFFSDRVGVSDAEILPIGEKALYRDDPRLWCGALMDFGALAMKDVKNPNRRSQHYAKQSRFEGSRRYARAKALEYILKKKTGSFASLQSYFDLDPQLEPYREADVLSGIVCDLVREGFFIKKGRFISIKS